MDTFKTTSTRFCTIALLLPGLLSGHAWAADGDIKESTLPPAKIIWISDSTGTNIRNIKTLLNPFSGQVSVNDAAKSAMLISTNGHKPSILIDFGKEIYGSLKLYSGMHRNQKPKHVRICLGESVTEAMSNTDIPGNVQNPTNEHSLRDFEAAIPWLGSAECGKSGFRFARIDFIDANDTLPLRYVEARSFIRDIPDVGSFECSDKRLNDIWNTGAYTVKLCMQDYVWDGIKRDRLVWLGDMHPEVMTAGTVWGELDVVKRSLDFAKDDTPLPGWINGMSAYSLWWLIIQRDMYMHTGNKSYLSEQVPYVKGLVDMLSTKISDDGVEQLDGHRFLDWPSSENAEAIHSGLQSLTIMALNAAADIGRWTSDKELTANAEKQLAKMKSVNLPHNGNKQAAALSIISGQSKSPEADAKALLDGGANGFSTFYGYYMLEALARTGHVSEALDIISDFWGSMLRLGATTFWEDFDYANADKASPIDSFTPAGKYDIHADGGKYCYVGLRLSLCHGWASGPTPWLTANVLGIRPMEPGCATIEIAPDLGNLEWAKGSFPTPKGPVTVSVTRGSDGKAKAKVVAPKGIKIINHAK